MKSNKSIGHSLLFVAGFIFLLVSACGRKGALDQGSGEAEEEARRSQMEAHAEAAVLQVPNSAGVKGQEESVGHSSDAKGAVAVGIEGIEVTTDAGFFITSVPEVSHPLEEKYSYQIETDHPDSSQLTYSLVGAPEGMSVSDTGLVTWVPTADSSGAHSVELKVSYGSESVEMTFGLEITGECQAGTVLGIWRGDKKLDSQYLGEILAYEGSESVEDNYGYSSASVHLGVGPEPKDNYGTVFFYRDGDGVLSLVFFFSRDDAEAGWNQVKWELAISNNSQADRILVYDDPNDAFDRSLVDDGTLYEADFWYSQNSDGGVIGPLVADQFEIVVKMKAMGNLQSAKFYSGTGHEFSLYEEGADHDVFSISYREDRICE